MTLHRFLLSLVACAALCGTQAASASTVYDAATDFSAAINPAGAWSYGYLDVSGTTFTPYTIGTTTWHAPSATGEIDAWDQGTYDSSAYSVVGHNPTATTQRENPGGSIFIPTGEAFVHPGNSGEKGTFRWTAPANGTVDISAAFKPDDSLGGNRDVHVYINGVDQIPGSFVIGSISTGNTVTDSQTSVAVTAGTKIDFAVGYGSDGVYYNDATGVAASVTFTAVPEPSTCVLFGLGAVGLLLAARRRRSA